MTAPRVPGLAIDSELKRKLLFTLLALVIYRVGAHIVAPGVNATALADYIRNSAAAGLRFAIHGRRGSFIKHGMDPQEDSLRVGGKPGDPGWGVDTSPGPLTVADQGAMRLESGEGVSGDYRHSSGAMRAAIRPGGPVPVSTGEALDVLRVIELGIRSSAERREVGL